MDERHIDCDQHAFQDELEAYGAQQIYYEPDGTVYEGAMNEKGEKDGYGKSVGLDGSIYEGEWQNNLKCGQGKITYANPLTECTRLTSKFEGTFADGLRNGLGVLYMRSGEVIRANWVNDMLHGEGVITNEGVDTKYIFYKNSRIQISGDVNKYDENDYRRGSCYQYDGCLCKFVVSLIVYLYILFAVLFKEVRIAFTVMAVLFWLLNLCCGFRSITGRYLQNSNDLQTMIKRVETLKELQPTYELVYSRDEAESVYTNSTPYKYNKCVSQSDSLKQMREVSKMPIFRLRIENSFSFTTDAMKSYIEQRQKFFDQNKQYFQGQILGQSVYDRVSFKNDKIFHLVYNSKSLGCKRFLLNTKFYAILTILGLHWIISYYLTKSVKQVRYVRNKQFQ